MFSDDPLPLLPAPTSFRTHDGVVVLGENSRVVSDPVLLPAVRWWVRVVEDAFGRALPVLPLRDPASQDLAGGAPDSCDVVFVHDDALPAGGYGIEAVPTSRGGSSGGDAGAVSGPARVVVTCADLPGAHAAAQSLRQLAGPAAFRRAPVDPPDTGGRTGADRSAVVELPVVTVSDRPRYRWRGVLLDVARHFLPKHDVLRFVDLAAMHKLNVVQLHLTDDQGWRFEVRHFPELTQAGAWRRESTVGTWRSGEGDGTPHGGFYTRDDLREIVAYARARGITVIPEIDVPGHVEAAVAAYPFLGTVKQRRGVRTTWGISEDVLDPSEESLSFFRHVLDEVVEVFDAPYIHLGGDEVPTTRWEESPRIRARAQALGLFRPTSDDGGAGVPADDGHPDHGADSAGPAADTGGPAREPDVRRLHGWFLARLARHVRSLGRRAMVWDEAFGPDLPRDVVVVAWQVTRPGIGAEALAAGHDVVVAPEHAYYLDHRASEDPVEPVPVGFVRTVEDVLAYDPDVALGLSGRDPSATWARRPLPAEPRAQRPGLRSGTAEPQVETLPSRSETVQHVRSPQGETSAGRLLGGQAQVWTEHLDSARRVDYATFPRLAAVAEALWSPAADRGPGTASSAEFLERLDAYHLPRLDAYGVEYRPPGGPHPWQRRPGVLGHARDLAAELPPAASTATRPERTVRSARAAGVDVVRGVRLPRADGTLSVPHDLHLAGGRIVRTQEAAASSGIDGRSVDGDGRVALPGLIDAHSHAEGVLHDPQVQHALLRQGVTTVVTGQDGVSYAPGDGSWPSAYFGAILGEHPGYRGPRVRDLLATYDDVVPVNIAYLAPHGTIRHEVLGGDPKRATLKEIAHMSRLLRQALDDGACGLSTGLEYLPGGYADDRELAALAAVVARRGLPHVSHMRGYEDKAGDGFAELVRIARESGVATHVSHYHGPAEELIGYVDAARAEGLDVTFDSYPYLRGCSILAMVALPGWLPLSDPAATVRALRDTEVAARLRREHLAELTDLWPRITFASVPALPGAHNLTWAEGRTLLDVAAKLGTDPAGAVLEILVATELRATCVFAQPPTNSADSVRALANHVAHVGGSDAIYLGGRPHPRGWGAFARMLSERVGSGDWTWYDAAEHLSGRTARRFGLAGRGVLDAGAVADVALVDPDTVRDRATYDLPRVVASGIDDVLVAGVPVLTAGRLTPATPGRALRPTR